MGASDIFPIFGDDEIGQSIRPTYKPRPKYLKLDILFFVMMI